METIILESHQGVAYCHPNARTNLNPVMPRYFGNVVEGDLPRNLTPQFLEDLLEHGVR